MDSRVNKDLGNAIYGIIMDKSKYVHIDVNRVSKELNIEPEAVIDNLIALESHNKIICNKVSGSVYSVRILNERK